MWEDDNPIRPVLTTTGAITGKWEFTNTVDESNMIEEDIMDRFCNNINLTTTTISDFIQQKFISGDNTPVFAHVYEPIFGTREVLVAHKHVPEALDLIRHIPVELCRYMSLDTINHSIVDSDNILAIANSTDPWQPFDIHTSIQATIYLDSPKRNTRQKRPGHNSATASKRSYSAVAKTCDTNNINHTINYPCPEQPQTNTTFPISHTTGSTANKTNIDMNNRILVIVTTLQSDITHLRNSIVTIDNKIISSIKTTSEDIQTAEQRCVNRIDALQTNTAKSISEISNTFLEQMKIQQQSTNTILLKLLETREESLLNKIDEKIQNIRNNNSHSPTQSPTRKKPSQTAQNAQVPEPNILLNRENLNPDQKSSIHSTTPQIINPYQHNSLRRRSVENTLPTTQR
jgi:hypothetical protein